MEQLIFSNNRKISTRQVCRTLTLEMLGISTLHLPCFLAGMCGTDGVFALILGAVAAMLMLKLWGSFTGKQTIHQALQNCCKGVRLVLSCMYGVIFLLIAGYALFSLTKVMEEQLLNVKFEPVILITLTAAGVFGVLKGLESRVRIYEVLFWFLIIPLIIILGLAAASVNVDYWPPVFAAAPAGFIRSVYISFVYFSIVSGFLLFQPHCSNPKRAIKGAAGGLIAVLLLNVAIYLILVGIFQSELLANLPYPVITLMAVVKLPGEFFERQDAFMTAIWFFCLFSLLNSMLFFGKEMLQGGVKELLPKKLTDENKQTGKGNSWWAVISGIAVLSVSLIFLRTETAFFDFWRAFVYVIFPVMILVPVVVFLLGRRKGERT